MILSENVATQIPKMWSDYPNNVCRAAARRVRPADHLAAAAQHPEQPGTLERKLTNELTCAALE